VQNLARAGDNIVSSTDLYGGTWNLFQNTLKDQGIGVRFVDPADPEGFALAPPTTARARTTPRRCRTRSCACSRSREVAAIGRRFGNPADHGQHRGADTGQAVPAWRCDRGVLADQVSRRPRHLDRRPDRRWRQLRLGSPPDAPAGTEHAGPELPWCGLVAGGQADGAGRLHHQGARDLVCATSARRSARSTHSCSSKASRRWRCAWSGTARTPSRSRNSSAGAREVTKVIHPSTLTGTAAEWTARYLPRGQGGLCGFELAGGAEAGKRFIDALKLFYHVANIGDARSLAIHPASTTHSQLTEAEQAETGVTPSYVRLSWASNTSTTSWPISHRRWTRRGKAEASSPPDFRAEREWPLPQPEARKAPLPRVLVGDAAPFQLPPLSRSRRRRT